MKNYTIFSLLLIFVLAGSCSKPTKRRALQNVMMEKLQGDSTFYGLACDGCTDTILVLLSDLTRDPDTFLILDASRNHKVFGIPKIGDQMAIMLNHDNPKQADFVVNVEQLQASWCYVVQPKLRERADISKDIQKKIMETLPDSVLEKLMKPREYGFLLKEGNTARPIGGVNQGNTTDDQGPVEYPVLKRYREWHLFNGHLILNETTLDSLGNQQLLSSDTADFVLMRRDTLVLRFADGERGYYRKVEEQDSVK